MWDKFSELSENKAIVPKECTPNIDSAQAESVPPAKTVAWVLPIRIRASFKEAGVEYAISSQRSFC